MSSIVTDKDTVFVDELIRENARLTVQHEADHQRILALCDRVDQLERENSTLSSQVKMAEDDLKLAADGMAREKVLATKLDQAIKDLHRIMAGGDACTVCKNKCLMGTADACEPRWKGLDD